MRILAVLFMLFLSACVAGPNYVRPNVATPVQFKEYKHWKTAQPREVYDRGEWWTIFRDPQLNALEAQLNISNQTIAVAEAHYQQARALVDEARAAYFPTIGVTSALSRQAKSSFATNVNGTQQSVATGISSSESLLLNASWTPDLWGAVRRNVEANAADAQASAAQLALVRLTAQAALAQYYFELRALDADQKLLDNTVRDYQKTLQLTKNRYTAGVAQTLDVVQAQSQLATVQTQAINNGMQRAKYEHAIAVLLGQPPANFMLNFKPLATVPPRIPSILPSELLERRPDIAQAERLMAKANAQVGLATAAYYPQLTLSGTYGFQNTNSNLAHLLAAPAVIWGIGPQLIETVFDGGLRANQLMAAKAGYAAAVAHYRQTVLTAFQEVEDNLVALRILEQEALIQHKATAEAQKALKITTNQYKAGITAYSNVLLAQTNAYTAAKTMADINGLRMSTAVALIMALGGNWHAG